MLRDGKLFNKEPGLNFEYVSYDRHDTPGGDCADPIVMTTDNVSLSESIGGIMRANTEYDDHLIVGMLSWCITIWSEKWGWLQPHERTHSPG